jgi:hypothetical protein
MEGRGSSLQNNNTIIMIQYDGLNMGNLQKAQEGIYFPFLH